MATAARKPSTAALVIPSAGSNGVQLPKRITTVELDKLKYDLFTGIPKQAVVTMTNANGGEVYEGQIDAKNKRSGKGTLRWPNGNVYFGMWADGSMCGTGIFLYAAENDTYKGEFKNDKKHGVGRYEFSNGNFYEGGFAVDKRHGKGRYSWTCGDSYEGDWFEGHMQGKGTTVYSNGNRYDGEFVADRREGHGKLVCADGLSYEGQWAKNMRHGTGRLQFPNGDFYEGDWDTDKKHGQGTDVFVNGNKFVGQYRDNMKHGQGTMTYANGDKYTGEWKADKMDGQGTYAFSNGFVYEGSWQQDVRHGRGRYSFPSGHVYTGEWRADKRHGAGQLVIAPSGDVYRGVWLEGKMHGSFIVERHSDWTPTVGASTATVCPLDGPTRKVYEGLWEQGVPTKNGVFYFYTSPNDKNPALACSGEWDGSTALKKSDGTIEMPQIDHWRAVTLLTQLSLSGKKTNHLLHPMDHVFSGALNRPLMDFYDAELQSFMPSVSAQQERAARLKHYAESVIPSLQTLVAQQTSIRDQQRAARANEAAALSAEEIQSTIQQVEAEAQECSRRTLVASQSCETLEQETATLHERQRDIKQQREQLNKQKEGINELKSQLQKLESQVGSLEKDVADGSSKVDALRDVDIPKAKQELLSLREEVDGKLTDAKAVKQAAQAEAAKALSDKEAALKAASKRCTEASAKSREAKTAIDSQVSKLNAQIAIVAKQIADAEKQKQAKKKRASDDVKVRAEKDQAALSAAKAEMDRLEQLLITTSNAQRELAEKCAAAAQRNAEANAARDARQREMLQLRDTTSIQTQKLHEADAVAQRQEEELVGLRKEEVELEKALEAAKEERCRQLQLALENKIKQHATGLSILNSEVDDLSAQTMELEKRKKIVLEEIELLERKLAAAASHPTSTAASGESPASSLPSSPNKKKGGSKGGDKEPGSPKFNRRGSVQAAVDTNLSTTDVQPPQPPAVSGKLRKRSTALLRDTSDWMQSHSPTEAASNGDAESATSTAESIRIEAFHQQQRDTVAELEKRVRAVERQNDEDEVNIERLLRQKKAVEEDIKSLNEALMATSNSTRKSITGDLAPSTSIDLSEAGKEAVRHQLIKARSKQSTLLKDQERMHTNITALNASADDLRRQMQEGSQQSVASIIASLRPEDWRLSYLVEQIEAKGKQISELEGQCAAIPLLEERLQSLKEQVASLQAKQQSSGGMMGGMAASSRRPAPF